VAVLITIDKKNNKISLYIYFLIVNADHPPLCNKNDVHCINHLRTYSSCVLWACELRI